MNGVITQLTKSINKLIYFLLHLFICRVFAPVMADEKGVIVNVSSLATLFCSFYAYVQCRLYLLFPNPNARI